MYINGSMNEDIKELVFGIVVGALFQVFSWTFFNKKKKS